MLVQTTPTAPLPCTVRTLLPRLSRQFPVVVPLVAKPVVNLASLDKAPSAPAARCSRFPALLVSSPSSPVSLSCKWEAQREVEARGCGAVVMSVPGHDKGVVLGLLMTLTRAWSVKSLLAGFPRPGRGCRFYSVDDDVHRSCRGGVLHTTCII